MTFSLIFQILTQKRGAGSSEIFDFFAGGGQVHLYNVPKHVKIRVIWVYFLFWLLKKFIKKMLDKGKVLY